MKAVVLGAGLMGKEVARDLAMSDDVKKIYLADLDSNRVNECIKKIGSSKIEGVSLNAEDDAALKKVMSMGDVTVNALFYKFNEKVAKAAIDIGVHSVDLGGHIGEITEKVLSLHEQAKQKGITIIPDLGVAPGMINILAGFGASQLEDINSIKLYVGGIPIEPEPPLNYTLVFSLEGVFDHYTKRAKNIIDGKLTEVEALTGIEPIYFDEFGMLEAFYTSGGTSTLYKTFPNVKTLIYKTVRYKGHAEHFKLLVDLDFLNKENTVMHNGAKVRVRDIIAKSLHKKLSNSNERDAVVLRAVISGEKSGEQITNEYEMILKRNEQSNTTAMARVTAGTICAVAIMIGTGKITERGVFPPESIVPGQEYIEKMAKRGINIKETSHRSSIVKW